MSSKRKQEERHLQLLKTMLQEECNKRCFECDQRGPTYVDVTIGSFICTSCGGILRGLNTPHRIKSVSMATFTPTEIAFIETKGNDYCKRIYLGKYDAKSKARPDSKNPEKLKFFMEEKYERKRWYVSPEEANKPLDSFVNSMANNAKDDKVKPLSSLLGNNAVPVQVNKAAPKQSPDFDTFLPDFNTPTPSNTAQNNNQTTVSTTGFADFNNAFSSSGFDGFGDFTSGQQSTNAPASTSAGFADFSSLMAPLSTGSNVQQQPAAVNKPADKYADLGDLFSIDNTNAPDITAMWSGFSVSSSNSSVSNTNTGVSAFGLPNTQKSTTLVNSANQPPNSIFGNNQPGASVFSNAPQQPANVFGTSATNAFGGMSQAGMMSGQPQTTTAFGTVQQQPGMFTINPQQTMPIYGNAQQSISASPYAGAQYNPAAMYGTSPQAAYIPQQTQGFIGGVTSANVPNPFMQQAATPAAQPANNPFMMQQQQQQQQPHNPFPAQSAATNPFMNSTQPPQSQMSNNPFF